MRCVRGVRAVCVARLPMMRWRAAYLAAEAEPPLEAIARAQRVARSVAAADLPRDIAARTATQANGVNRYSH